MYCIKGYIEFKISDDLLPVGSSGLEQFINP